MASPKNIFLYQNEIEKAMLDLGKARYHKEIAEAVRKNHESTTPAGIQILNGAHKKVYERLEQAKGDHDRGAPIMYSPLAYIVLDYLPLEVIAFLALKVCINYMSSPVTAQKIAVEIGTVLEDEYRLRNFKSQNPALFGVIMRDLEKRTSNYRRQKRVLIYSANKAQIDIGSFPATGKMRVGTFLIDQVIAATGLFEVQKEVTGKTKRALVFRAAPKTAAWLRARNDIFSLLSPVKLPSILYPRPWEGIYKGGYYTFQMPLIKSPDNSYLEKCQEYIEAGKWEPVLDAVNTVQKTGWRINKKILEVMRHYYEAGIDTPVLPQAEEIPIKTYPNGFPEDWLKEDIIDWKRKTGKIHEQNVRIKTKRLQLSQLMWVAEKYKTEDCFYFPHTIDFRGRLYPSSAFLNPQGEDTGRSLLEFSKGLPLGGTGLWWLGVHGANCYGFDKVSLQDRYRWTAEHDKDIRAAANDPYGCTFWMEADKPWQFLAFCFEWAGDIDESTISHLPVQVDGSCNGLQHFSALCRDAEGGAAVNLLAGDTPADIYEIVAQRAREINEDPDWDGKILRGIVKRPVMTTPYGATPFGMRAQIQAELKHMRDKGIDLGFSGDYWQESNSLAKTVWEAIGDTLVSAREVMVWLQESAKAITKGSDTIFWHVPSGFFISQRYLQPKRRSIRTILNGKIAKLTLVGSTSKADARKHANAISPNLVHSLDACHLMMAVNKAKAKYNINSFMVVHDSFGTHASSVSDLVEVLKETFHEMYTKEDILDGLANELRWQTEEGLPEKPKMGTLEMDKVLESEFFFA